MERPHFFDKKLVYVCSFDLDLGVGRGRPRKRREVVTSSARVFGESPADRQPVYNALGEPRVLGEPAPTGRIAFSQDTIEYLPDCDFADLSGRVVIRTDDDQVIEAEYRGVARSTRGWLTVRNSYGRLRSSDDNPTRVGVQAHIGTRFETGSSRFRWLTLYHCVGYGELTLEGGEPDFVSFDIYALQ